MMKIADTGDDYVAEPLLKNSLKSLEISKKESERESSMKINRKSSSKSKDITNEIELTKLSIDDKKIDFV